MKKLLTIICLCATLLPTICHAKGLAVWGDANYIKHPMRGYYRFIITEGEEFTDAQRQSLKWVVFKQNHDLVKYECKSPKFPNEEAMQGAWCAEWNLVKGDIYTLCDGSVASTLFRGYSVQPTVLLADDVFINSHTFPGYNRWMAGENIKKMPAAFVTKMRQRYGRPVKASYEAASLRGASGVLAVTDFGVVNGSALVVYTWLENGKEVCSHEMRRDDIPDDEKEHVWSLDDEGVYGLPEVTTIARDKATGNIEFFVVRFGSESTTNMHFVQNGTKLELKERTSRYMWIDTKMTSDESLKNPVLEESNNFTDGLTSTSVGTPDDNGFVYRYADFDVMGELCYGEVEGSPYCVWTTAVDSHDDSDPTLAWGEDRPDGSTWERDFGSEQIVAGTYGLTDDARMQIVVCKRWYDKAHKKSGVGIAVVFPDVTYAKFHYLSQGSCCVTGDAKVQFDGKSIIIDHNSHGLYTKWTWDGTKFVDESNK